MSGFRNSLQLVCAVLCSIAALLPCTGLRAQVTLPQLFSDHAVLQRGKPIQVWGSALAGEQVQVTFHHQTVTATADKWGSWELWLNPELPGGPYTLTVRGSNQAEPVERTDILVGDVWIASGQSNMEFPLAGFTNAPLLHGEDEIAHATQPIIRLLNQPHRVSSTVLTDSDAAWTLCTPATARKFSAVAYFFGREVSMQEKVPIGLIDATWGGTPAQAWLSGEAIAKYHLDSVIASGARGARDKGRNDALRARFAAQDAAAQAAGATPGAHARLAYDHQGSWAPSALFNGMIAPLTRYTIKGAIWYQGEADATTDGAPNYARVFSALIQDWREQWSQGSFPFLFVQLSSFSDNNNDWGMVRDQQRQVAQDLANTGMAVSLDVGLHDNVHPPDKQTVAHRLALLARSRVYGENVEADSPQPSRVTVESGKARIWLDHAEGLHTVSGEPGDFEIAGEDGKFFPASASISDGGVTVESPSVTNPRFVRYGWKGTVTRFLLNGVGLPLGTFTESIP